MKLKPLCPRSVATRWVFPTVKTCCRLVVQVRSSKVAWTLGFYELLEDQDANVIIAQQCCSWFFL